MELDDFQRRWLAQDQRIEEALVINKQLWLRAELAGPRRSLRWLRVDALFSILFGALSLIWTGSFLSAHFAELRFVVPGAAPHLWLLCAVATTLARFIKAAAGQERAPARSIHPPPSAPRPLTQRSRKSVF